MGLQGKPNIHPFLILFIVIVFINIIMIYPIVIVIIAIFFFKGKIDIGKVLQKLGITDMIKKQFGTNYGKIISEIKKSKKYKQRVRTNSDKRAEVEDLFTDNKRQQIDEKVVIKSEDKFKKMQEEHEEKQNKEKVFYNQNQKVLQEKFAESAKQKKTENKTRDSFKSSRSSQSNNNFFGNSHKSKLFGENKSIWDDYESVTDKFSSKNK